MERHGEKVGKNCMVEQCLHSDSQCGCKSAASVRWETCLWGKYHENHQGNKEQQRGEPVESVCSKQVQEGDQPSLPIHDRSFVAHGRSWMPCAPASETIGSGGQERKPFDQGATHTGRRRRRFFQKPVAGLVVVSFLDIEPH